jgi:siroheme synthase
VVRLKGGDPFVFGRGSEEALACAEAGVPWEVVPGVSSVLGATGRAAIPLTARGVSGSFAVVTAHRAGQGGEPDWEALARMDTLVVLMGVERLEHVVERLAAAGRAAETPVAIVERGTLPDERVLIGTLGDIALAARAAEVRSPALIVVGEAVALREPLLGAIRAPALAASAARMRGEERPGEARHVA